MGNLGRAVRLVLQKQERERERERESTYLNSVRTVFYCPVEEEEAPPGATQNHPLGGRPLPSAHSFAGLDEHVGAGK